MLEFATPTAAKLKSITPRTEHHGDDEVVAISMRLEITGPNTILDRMSPALRHALYVAPEGQEALPGIQPPTPLLRFSAFEGPFKLKACLEGWTVKVAHGIDDDTTIVLGGSKVDEFKVDAMQGGTVALTFRVGTNDVSSEEIGVLCGKLGSEIQFSLHAPEKPREVIDASSDAKDLPPDAGSLFAAEHTGDPGDDDADGEGSETDAEAVTLEGGESATLTTRSPAGSRTARGRDKTKAALAAGKH